MISLSRKGDIMRSYSQDLRDRVLRAIERGEGPTTIAKRFEVSRIWVYQVRDRFETEGLRHSFQIGGHRQSRIAPFELQVRTWIKEEPDLTLAELCERLAKNDVSIKPSALWHQLDKWGLSFKKNSTRQRARAGRRTDSSNNLDEKSIKP